MKQFLISLLVLSACLLSLSIGLGIGMAYQANLDVVRDGDNRLLGPSVREAFGLLTFHGQNSQDRWVAHAARRGIHNGFFVDLGSGDGVYISNTKTLEDIGWNGICIDPFPQNMQSRRCTVRKEVVTSRVGDHVTFLAPKNLRGGIESLIGKNRFDEEISAAPTVELTTTTLDTILEQERAPRDIDYVSMDIEGAELEALKGFNFSKYTVGAWTIEHNFEEPKRSNIREFLEARGYRLVDTLREDDCYVLASKR